MRGRSLQAFLVVAILLAIPALWMQLTMDKFALHLVANVFHGPWLDQVFPVFTEFANGWVPTGIALLLLFKSWRAFLMMGLSAGLSAIGVQMLKRLVFSAHDRPSMYLEQMPGLRLVPGVALHQHFSFPSGHATAAFSMCLAMAVIIGKRGPAVLLAIFAACLGYSRVYLSMHFTEDVLAGAGLGCLFGTAVYWLLYQGPWAGCTGLDKSPFRR
jgi:membrane-associated phospholipid phosphatase